MRGATVQRAAMDGRGVLEIATALVRQDVPQADVREQLIDGIPARQLVESAAEAAMIVLGARGHGGFASLLLGSTSQRVAAHAPCPVVVVGQDAERPPTGRIVLGLNVHKASAAALEFAFSMAARTAAELHVIYGWAVDDTYARFSKGSAFNLDELREQERQALSDVLDPWIAKAPQVNVVQLALDATADAALVAASAEADLLVLSARRARTGPRHLGPVVHSALRHATCPVAVVPEEL